MRALILSLMILSPVPVAAQSWPNATGPGPVPTIGDQHRWEMERLRARSDANEALARRQDLETRLTILELQAARRPAPPSSPSWRGLRSPEEERALGESAAERREATVGGVTQIDAWLDRLAPR